jgi:hypothetical protein
MGEGAGTLATVDQHKVGDVITSKLSDPGVGWMEG